jgi:hypothetical protein
MNSIANSVQTDNAGGSETQANHRRVAETLDPPPSPFLRPSLSTAHTVLSTWSLTLPVQEHHCCICGWRPQL